ncbi:tetratricopeptide repeat protein [Photobacterium lipolyticum]|uniref:Uncharacterized protein n=1 Tax=Photobacterium lipolyticum TaxID=266810 RepID=A0A2T3MZ48_9GAMM|nr:hypothetical protein [Photobacterium lipolyticum]PSW05231.1 hypothetical protein C9I89_10655 [Photobacterium lipolyticum]
MTVSIIKPIYTLIAASLVANTLMVKAAAAAPQIPAEVMASYAQAIQGDTSSTEKTFDLLTALQKEHPRSALINTVLGSTETMMGRDAWTPWNKMEYVDKGLSRMDKAVKLLQADDHKETFEGTPVSLWVKTTVGCTFIEMPEMFHRLDAGYQLLENMIKSEEVKPLPFAMKAYAYFCAGKAASLAGEPEAAQRYLNTLLANVPGSPQAIEAKALLAEIVDEKKL